MRTINNAQNWEMQDVRMWETSMREPQDICMWETSRAHQQNNWWPNNQPDTTSFLQLPQRKFQEQRRHVVNYEEEEYLSWCNKCGVPGHIQAFCAARVFCRFCRMRFHSNKTCWNQQRNKCRIMESKRVNRQWHQQIKWKHQTDDRKVIWYQLTFGKQDDNKKTVCINKFTIK